MTGRRRDPVWRWVLWACLCACLCACMLSACRVQPGAQAAPRAAATELSSHWQLLTEPGAQWTLADAQAHAAEFRQASRNNPVLGYTADALWARLELPADQLPQGTLWLMMRAPRLESVRLWQRGADGGWSREQSAGLSVPQSQWPLDLPGPTFELQRPPPGEPLVLMVRQAGRTVPSWDALLCSPRECQRSPVLARWVSALVIGSQLLVVAGCVLLFGIWRQRAWLLLAGYAFSHSLYEFSQQGWGFQLLWPDATDWAARSLNVLVTLTQALQTACIVALLRRKPAPMRVLLYLGWAAQAVVLCGSMWGDYRAFAPYCNALNFLMSMLTLGLGVWAFARRLPQGGAIALAMLLTVSGTLPRYLLVFGLMAPGNPLMLSTPLLVLVTTMQMIWVLVDRVGALNRDRLQAQERLLVERVAREQELQVLVGERTAQLSGALRDAQQLNRQRSRLLAYIGHDLRAPLSATVSYLRQLRRGSDPDQQLQASVEQAVAYQLSLIDELMEFSRGELQELELLEEPIYAWGLLMELAGQGELLAQQRGNTFEIDFASALPAVVVADAKRLRQLLMNLLSNAAKFTVRGRVAFKVGADAAGLWRFEVVDDGPGVSPEDRAHLFEPFWRSAAASARDGGGTGLGLAIARHLAQAMGGRILFESAAGRGSRFTVELPLASATAAEVQLPGAKFGPIEALPAGSTVLLIDTPPAHADQMAEMLFAANLDVERGVQLARAACTVTLLLCDPELLDDEGRTWLGQWREASPRHRSIALLARPVEPASAGLFDACLYKPVGAAALAAALRLCL